jgi:acetyl esterase/lipase
VSTTQTHTAGRRAWWCGVALVVGVVVGAGCLTPPEGAAPLRYRDEVFSDVTKTGSVVYASPTSRHTGLPVDVFADLYAPTGDTATNRPAVIWIHGGSFRSGSRTSGEIVDEANTFAKKGYVSVSISYRLSPTGCTTAAAGECLLAITDALADAQSAVRWLRANAATYGVDPVKIAIAGSSAGAVTALNVGFNSEAPQPGPLAEVSSRVSAAVSLSGGAVGGTIDAGDAPSLLFHNTDDPIAPYSLAQSTVTASRAAGVVSWLITWPGNGHVPYAEHRPQIIELTTNFLYSALALAPAG